MKLLLIMIATIFILQIANAQSVVFVQSSSNQGTAFFITKSSSLTAGHVCDGINDMYYRQGEDVYITRSVVISMKYDLCYIEWDRENPNSIPMALYEKDDFFRGMVYTSGFPHGVMTVSTNLNMGKVLGGELFSNDPYWLCSARLSADSGASGSPVFTDKNEVLGVLVILNYITRINEYVCVSEVRDFLENEVN